MGESLWVRVSGSGLVDGLATSVVPYRRVIIAELDPEDLLAISSLGMFRGAMSLNSILEFQKCDALTD